VTITFTKFATFAILASLALLSACGGATNSNSNATNSKNSNTNNANSSASSSSTPAVVSDKPPITTTLDNLQLSSDFYDAGEFPGRMITASGYINAASEKTLTIGYSYGSTAAGNHIDCKGDFSKYSGLSDKANAQAKDNKAIKATVKGSVKSISDKTLILEPCVLEDLAK